MTSPELPRDVSRRLAWLTAHFTCTAAFAKLTAFGPTFPLLLRQLQLDEGQIGVVLALIPFCQLVAPGITPLVARIGFRRSFLLFYTLRQVFLAGLLLTPLAAPGPGAFLWVSGCIFLFGIGRATAEVGVYPWLQEIIPNDVRGKFNAVMTTLATAAGMGAAALGGAVIRGATDIRPYLTLIGMGICFALAGVLLLLPVRTGGVRRDGYGPKAHRAEMHHALRDANFTAYLAAAVGAILASSALFGFLPLFLKEEVRFPAEQAVWLDMAVSLGGMLASFPAGWIADRQGSKPVMRVGLGLMVLAPPLLLLLRAAGPSLPVAATAIALAGAASTAWLVAMDRYFFVGAVPPERSAGYTAVYYSAIGLAGGLGPMLAGFLVRAGRSGGWVGSGPLASPYAPLFGWCMLLLLVATTQLARLRPDRTA